MIISPGRRYIFVHIPKTGGTSMSLALEARAHRDDVLIGDTPKAIKRRNRLRHLKPAGRLWKHSTLADIDGIVTPQAIQGMFCFCLVRNPWDRMVSYYHWLGEQAFDHPAVTLAKASSFAEFVEHEFTRKTVAAWPYARYMRDVTGREHASLFLRLEHMAEDILPLARHIGFVPQIPHANRSQRAADFREHYTPRTQGIVAETCAEDIARFGYSF